MASLRHIAFMLALVGTVVPAAAQRTFPQTGPAPEGALPGPNATPAQADQHSSNVDNNVQPVPGAMPGSSTIPSTISEKNAADDKLIIVAYTFKNLTADERATIFNGLKNGSAQPLNAEIGTELPVSVKLRPLPNEVVAQVPQTKGYDYIAANNKVFLVQAPTRFVVAVIDEPAAATTGSGSPPR